MTLASGIAAPGRQGVASDGDRNHSYGYSLPRYTPALRRGTSLQRL